MANLTGTGAPTKRTVGAIGDIYTDTKTGNHYKCTFAYKSEKDDTFDCDWVKLKSEVTTSPAAHSFQTISEPPVEDVLEDAEDKKEELKTEVKPPIQQRKDYSAYSKKNK